MARKIRAKEILRLRDAGLSRTSIAKTQHMSKTSVCDVFDAADRLGMSWEDVRDKAEEDVYRALFPERNIEEDPFDEPDWERVHSEMAKVGVTLKLLHAEYVDQCAERHVAAMSYDRFCKRYRRWTAVQGISSRVGHKAATIVEVDWSGPTMRIVDPGTGEVQKVYLFVACLPFSRYAYVEPTLDMKEGTWLRCHVRMFAFFGGSVPCIVPDNLRTGIRKHPKEGEPELNDAYREMAAHYGCAVMPARVRKPKDKPSVENTVGNIATAIIAKLRGREFTSLDQLASAVRGALDEYNAAPFQKRPGSSEYLHRQAPVIIAARHRLRRESAPGGGAVQHRPLMRPQLNASGSGAGRCCCPDGSTHARLSHAGPCGLVDDTVHDRLGRGIGTEPGMPALLPVLGAEDRRPLVAAEPGDLGQEAPEAVVWPAEQPSVEDEDLERAMLPHGLRVSPVNIMDRVHIACRTGHRTSMACLRPSGRLHTRRAAA